MSFFSLNITESYMEKILQCWDKCDVTCHALLTKIGLCVYIIQPECIFSFHLVSRPH